MSALGYSRSNKVPTPPRLLFLHLLTLSLLLFVIDNTTARTIIGDEVRSPRRIEAGDPIGKDDATDNVEVASLTLDQDHHDDSRASIGDLSQQRDQQPREKIAGKLDDIGDNEEDGSVVKKRRRNELAFPGKLEDHRLQSTSEQEENGIRRFDALVGSEDNLPQGNSANVANLVHVSHQSDEQSHGDRSEESAVRVSRQVETEKDDDAQSTVKGKSKHKTSTVYLNADDPKILGSEQESIVEGQIKKLISIRNDVLGTVNEPILESTKVLSSEKEVDINSEVIDQADDRKELARSSSNSLKEAPKQSILEKWKSQAGAFQEQIKNKTFFQQLKDGAIEVLPGIPKFNENQLLESLKYIVSSKGPSTEASSPEVYAAGLEGTKDLTENQVEIIKCAGQLVSVREQQSLMSNMLECIRGLSVFNCMRIFVWPIVLNNIPQSMVQNLPTLPIEISLLDLFQGNRAKSARAHNFETIDRVRLLTPEPIIFRILKDALESNPSDESSLSYIDPKNETLRALLSSSQVEILRMAERLLPKEVRQEYSNRMYSCVQRYEYFSCVKYFTWPMIKQSMPALPAYPDYQSWYPTVALLPEYPYPIMPLPIFSDDVVQLSEVVDADGTRTREPRPENQYLRSQTAPTELYVQQPLLYSAQSPSPVFEQSVDPYVALIPRQQWLAIEAAQQYVPLPYRPEFTRRTIECIRQYNYVTCFRNSPWMTRQNNGSITDFLGGYWDYVPSISTITGAFSTLPSYIPSLSNFSSLFSNVPFIGGGAVNRVPQPSQNEPSRVTPIVREDGSRNPYPEVLETKLLQILQDTRNSLDKETNNPSSGPAGTVVVLPSVSEKQLQILRLAESLVPPVGRTTFTAQVYSCLERNSFADCNRYVVWPFIAPYAPQLPQFPTGEGYQQEAKQEPVLDKKGPITLDISIKTEERITAPGSGHQPSIQITSRSPASRESSKDAPSIEGASGIPTSVPVISVTGTRFVPIFTEHPESVIYNILRSVQGTSAKENKKEETAPAPGTHQLLELLNEQQASIIRMAENLLPEMVRTVFVERMLGCVRQNSFLLCSRDVLWPTLLEYCPRVPSFPNFGILIESKGNGGAAGFAGFATFGNSFASSSASSSSSNYVPLGHVGETSSHLGARPLSETNVKTAIGHGDATVTITDTRFFPIFNEHPEAVLLNILRAVELSTPNLAHAPLSKADKLRELFNYLTEQQTHIVQITANLLPLNVRDLFAARMTTCVQDGVFLDCMRDVAWPTLAQYFPRLPHFPNFPNMDRLQNLPRANVFVTSQLAQSRTPIQNKVAEPPKLPGKPELKTQSKQQQQTKKESEKVEDKIEEILTKIVPQVGRAHIQQSSLNDRNSAVTSKLTSQQVRIVKLMESAIPEQARANTMLRMLECLETLGFAVCTQDVAWPLLRQWFPGLPSYPGFPGGFADAASQIPSFPQPPSGGQIPGIGDIGGIGGIGSIGAPIQGIPSFPGGIPSFPGGGFATLPDDFLQIAGQIPPWAFLRVNAPLPLASVPPVRIAPHGQAHAAVNTAPSSSTPSVGNQEPGIVPAYAGQPPGIFLDISNEKVELPEDDAHFQGTSKRERNRRNRRSTVENTESDFREEKSSSSVLWSLNAGPKRIVVLNMTENKFLELLNKAAKNNTKSGNETSKKNVYFVDSLDSTMKNSLSATQYEILKLVEDLNEKTSERGFMQRVVACIRSLSFLRCMYIFVWPMVSSNLPSLPSFPSVPGISNLPGLATGLLPFGRKTEDEIEQVFGMSTVELERELLSKKKAMEQHLHEEYQKLHEKKFRTSVAGILEIRGYGNGQIGIALSGSRRARGTKIKDNKNLPSILTIISDIMEEVLDQRPDSEKIKKDKDKEKRERSIDTGEESNIHTLENTHDESFAKLPVRGRSEDDSLISSFLSQIKPNDLDTNKSHIKEPSNINSTNTTQSAYHAFQILFGSRSNGRFSRKVTTLTSENLQKEEETKDREEQCRKRWKRVKSLARALLNVILDDSTENKLDDRPNTDPESGKSSSRTELIIRLPRVDEDILSKKITNSLAEFGRGMKTRIGQMMPGIGLAVSFMINLALAHARAAASIAGIMSNMALSSAVMGILRETLFGPSTHPKIKYVYDNEGPVDWASQTHTPVTYHHG